MNVAQQEEDDKFVNLHQDYTYAYKECKAIGGNSLWFRVCEDSL